MIGENKVNVSLKQEDYDKILENVLATLRDIKAKKKNHAVIFLGGQPGAGKSTFYNMEESFYDYIKIDGDQYRKYHPGYTEMCEDEMVEKTQPFVNRMVEDIISRLSDEGYNLLIEGTLRDASVPINTATELRTKGYTTELYVIACNACNAWESTLKRLKLMRELQHSIPRTVGIEKYSSIVNLLPENLRAIEHSGCMDRIVILNRDNEILWSNLSNKEGETAETVLSCQLNLQEWNSKYDEYKRQYEGEVLVCANLAQTVSNEGEQTTFHRRRGGR